MQDQSGILKRVRIKRITRETPLAKTFELEPLDGWQPEYEAGQYITLVFPKDDSNQDRRSYSFSSAPALGEPMRITVKWVTNGAYSRRLLDYYREGDVLLTSGISGFFRIKELERTQKYFFLAAGSGITPVMSIIKTLLHTTNKPVILIYSNRSVQDTLFYDELNVLLEQFPERFRIEYLFSDIFNVYKSRLSNWLLLQLLPKLTDVPVRDVMFYLCGPFSYMQMISITLLGEGVPKEHIIKENFSTEKPVRKSLPPDTAAHNVTIHINGQTFDFRSAYPDSILSSAKKEGISLPYSCEAGRCGSCTATCTEGKVWMAYNEVLLDDEIAKGRVLTCQGFPVQGDVTLEF